MYPLEVRQEAARRVQTLLGLFKTQNFVEDSGHSLPNNILR